MESLKSFLVEASTGVDPAGQSEGSLCPELALRQRIASVKPSPSVSQASTDPLDPFLNLGTMEVWFGEFFIGWWGRGLSQALFSTV